MAGRAVIIGATGQIGWATVPALLDDGWEVTAVQRDPARAPADWLDRGVIVASADRSDREQLRAAMADGADVVIDVVPNDARDARRLLELSGDIGQIVAISTAGVYADAHGRGFPGSPDAVPDYPVPIREDQPTVAPAPDAYHTAKVELEETLLAESPAPVTIIRPGAIYGPGSTSPREWWPLMRALDRRPAIPLAFGGRSRFHTCSARNLAELIRLAAGSPGTRVLNGADPTADDARTLSEAVCATADHQPEIVTYDGWPPDSGAGSSPWSVPMPVVLDMTAAERELGYRPVTTYAEAVVDTCAWLREITHGRPWQDALPEIPKLYGDRFGDYDAEDELLARLAR